MKLYKRVKFVYSKVFIPRARYILIALLLFIVVIQLILGALGEMLQEKFKLFKNISNEKYITNEEVAWS